MKKKIIVGICITACVALCAAVWTRSTEVGNLPAEPIKTAVTAEIEARSNEVRPVFKRLCAMADRTGCAIILIGHMNKAQGLKSSYRGLGSIDFRAAARSVLLVGRLKNDPAVRVVAHDKSSLAPEGKSIAFSLDQEALFIQYINRKNNDETRHGIERLQRELELMRRRDTELS